MSLEIETVFRNRAQSRGLLLSALGACAAWFRGYLRRRATHKALAHLTDEDLRDIGLMRTAYGYEEIPEERLRLPHRR